MIRVLLSVVFGAAIAGAAAWIVSADDAGMALVVPCVIALSVLWPLVLIVRGLAGVGGGPGFSGTPSTADVAQAQSEGRLALARVKHIARTGTSINDQPVCDLDLVVVPRHGPAFEVRTRRLVDLLEIPRLQPEQLVVVMTAERGPSPVTVVMDPPDEWVLQAQADEHVRTVRSAPPFTPGEKAGAAGAAAPGAPGTPRRATGLRRIPPVLYLVGALVGAGLALIPAYPTIGALFTGQTTLDEVRQASSSEGSASGSPRAPGSSGSEAEHAA